MVALFPDNFSFSFKLFYFSQDTNLLKRNFASYLEKNKLRRFADNELITAHSTLFRSLSVPLNISQRSSLSLGIALFISVVSGLGHCSLPYSGTLFYCVQLMLRNDRGFSYKRNCRLRRWESETLDYQP